MQTELNIARALLHDPPVVFLDEPTIGLDPNSARKVREVVLELKAQGRTILLTTHNMFEADMLCDRVAIINRGTIIAVGTPGELKSRIAGHKVVEIEAVNLPADELLDKVKGVDGVFNAAARVRDPASGMAEIRVIFDGDDTLRRLLQTVLDAGVKILGVKSLEPTLEDVFVYYTGERLEGQA